MACDETRTASIRRTSEAKNERKLCIVCGRVFARLPTYMLRQIQGFGTTDTRGSLWGWNRQVTDERGALSV